MNPQNPIKTSEFLPADPERDEFWMRHTLTVALRALEHEDVPIGAVVISPEGQVYGEGWNTRERDRDPCGHAELNALRAAAKARGEWRLEGCTIYVTLEPCAMCAGAMVLSRIQRCVWGAADPKGGFLGTLGSLHQYPGLNHHFDVTGMVLAEEGGMLLKRFFRQLRENAKSKKQA